MAAEKFRAVEDSYYTLRGQFDTGRITQQQFEEKLHELMVQDASGRYWMLGADSGNWYFYDGVRWVEGDPLSVGATALATPTRTPPGFSTVSQPGFEPEYRPPAIASTTPGGCRFPLVAFLVGAALVILALAAFLVFQNRNRIFVAQRPSAQITPLKLATPTSILNSDASQTESLNTATPVPFKSVIPPGIATTEPTTRLGTVIPTPQASANIPTVTPLILNTPVTQSPLPTTLSPTGRLRAGNGPDARARYVPALQFVLDGALNEWSGDGVPLTVPHFGVENWQGPRDLSGTAWLGWNENALLIAVNVVDDVHVQTQQGWDIFRGDSVELWIDADLEGDFDVAAGNADDYQFGFSAGDFAGLVPEGVVYIPYRDAAVNQQILVAAQPNSAGYTLEAAIPWGVLRAQPGQGRVFGYMVDLSDNDVPATAQQQTQVNDNPNFQFQMPATFGNLILE